MGACCSCHHDKPLECDKTDVHVSDLRISLIFIKIKPKQIPEHETSSSISSIYENQQREENTPGPEIEVDLEIPAIPYQVEHVRRMSSDDEEIICDVTRNEVIEYTVVGKYRLIYRIDSDSIPCQSFPFSFLFLNYR